MAKKIGIGVAVVVVAFLGFVMTKPGTFHVERSRVIDAPVDVAFGLVNNVENRHQWYPWDRLDPNMTLTYGDNKVGVGATYSWKGNDQVGEGSQTILESVPNQKVVDDLHFKVPFESRNKATFTFAPEGDKTKVTWALDGGDGGFGAKLMNVFMDMDSAVGADFEKGLGYLDEAAQKAKQEHAAAVAKADADAKAGEDAAGDGEGEPENPGE